MTLDLGTLSGKVELDIAEFDRKYATVDQALAKLEGRQVKDVQVGADTEAATRDLGALETFLTGTLDGMRAEVAVQGDTGQADAAIGAVESMLRRLDGDAVQVKVDADVSPAESAIDGLGDEGEAAGDEAGQGMSAGIMAGLAAIPIAGGVAILGATIARGLFDAISDGLQQEAGRDLFSARTGLDAATAAKFGQAAGNAYGSAWGDSVEANLDTARQALQGGLIDADATTAEVEEIISSLSAVSDILGEDIPRLSRSAGVMLKTGLADSAQDAFDILVAGTQAGANVSEDLLDTFTEYPAVFERLGLDGETAMGLISQAMQAGARDTDYAADALKEFQIRATDGSKLSGEAFELLGLDAEEMTAKIARGGEHASGGLGTVLDRLRDMEDPVKRNEAAVGLFGTKAEDLGDALYAMDTASAVSELEELGDVAGRAGEAMTTLSDNAASQMESARRSIELAGEGIKGALASAFSDDIGNLADFVTKNRAGVLEFLGDIANGFFDMGAAGVEVVAGLMTSFGDFVSTVGPQMVGMVISIIEAIDEIPGIDIDDSAVENLRGMQQGMHTFGLESAIAADALRENLITNGIDVLQERFNEGLGVEILNAQVHDMTTRLVSDIGAVGEAVEGLAGIGMDGLFDTATTSGAMLDEQLRAAIASLGDVQGAAQAAGEGQESLAQRFTDGRDAIVAQLEAMGYSREEALALAEAYGAVPTMIETSVALETAPARMDLNDLVVEVDAASGTVTINGDKVPASSTLGDLIGNVNASDGTVTINGNKVPADMTLEQLLGVIGGSAETVTINGNDYPAESVLGGLVNQINNSSGTVSVYADTSGASYNLNRWIQDNSGRTVTVYQALRYQDVAVATGGDVDVLAAGAMQTRFAGGGSVVGPGTGTSDDVPASHPSGIQFQLSNGEHVLTADDVLDVGGQAEVFALRSLIQSGAVRDWMGGTGAVRMADGGPVGPAQAPTGTAVATLPERIELHSTIQVDSREIGRAAALGTALLGGRITTSDRTRIGRRG
ncbi:phage tail tape measure protein [Ornithinimicrobium cerasi]|uniref:phage tail tape measure protein n=1 Tax=Ornithinimicrobium cerasi TaxID=2248773 RepID=UPI000EFE3CB1|nr:phage tail tape measure protein [Ornithinimicrobium cerasi]